MRAIQVHKFIEDASEFKDMDESKGDEYLSMEDNIEKPAAKNKKELLVRVFACSVAPGDQMVAIQGQMVVLQPPLPCIPGMDVCGEVVDHNGSALFQNGDVIVASNGTTATGGLAEFMVVNEDECALKPPGVSVLDAASCSSAATARNAVMDNVKKGDRVLVLGGSGGVGSAAIQIAKNLAGASFVATTSTQTEMCQRLGADRVINYRDEDWWKIKEFCQQEKFDVIIDTVGGGNFYGRASEACKTGKQGGTFVAVTGDDNRPDLRTVWKFVKFMANTIGRMIYTKFTTRKMPRFVMLFPYDENNGRKDSLQWMKEGSLVIQLDKDCPLPFTAKGVRHAFAKVAGGHAHGKVVIEIAKQEESK